MPVNETAKVGSWSDPTVWTLGHVPLSTEDVTINDDITIDTTMNGLSITIDGSSMSVSSAVTGFIECNIPTWKYNSYYIDSSTIFLSGLRLNKGIRSCISCFNGTGMGLYRPVNETLFFDGNVTPGRSAYTMSDPGYPSLSVGLVDQITIGNPISKSMWRSSGVRSISVRVRWPRATADKPYDLLLWAMQAAPYNVLLVTCSCIIKGHIESIQYRDTSGKTDIEAQITVVEG